MREIDISEITLLVKKLCLESNIKLPEDLKTSISGAVEKEESELGKDILSLIIKNADIAEADEIAVCQDTGMTVVFCEVGQDVHLVGGNLNDAINQGVREGYKEGYFRNSVVSDPFIRNNTKDNTPAVIHQELVSGDRVKITVLPKGFGSENMSALKMLKPSEGVEGLIRFVVETVENAGPNPCPPLVIGIGVGGTMEKAALLAKKALMRPIEQCHKEEHVAKIEKILLDLVNSLGIGPQGLGGTTTALKVSIETYPTHIAGMPAAINLSCHATRHASGEI